MFAQRPLELLSKFQENDAFEAIEEEEDEWSLGNVVFESVLVAHDDRRTEHTCKIGFLYIFQCVPMQFRRKLHTLDALELTRGGANHHAPFPGTDIYEREAVRVDMEATERKAENEVGTPQIYIGIFRVWATRSKLVLPKVSRGIDGQPPILPIVDGAVESPFHIVKNFTDKTYSFPSTRINLFLEDTVPQSAFPKNCK